MRHNSIKRVGAMLMALAMSATIGIQASAAGIAERYALNENGMSGATPYSYKAMYDYDTDSIDGVELTNAVYNYDTYACTIARVDRNGTPSVTQFQLLARIVCNYSSGSDPTSVADDQEDEIYRTLGSSGIYLNSGNADYRTPMSNLESLKARNYFNDVFFNSEFFEGDDFYIS